jgi:hypothetical protein
VTNIAGRAQGHVYKIEWSNPYTKPPAGMPLVLAEMFVPTDGYRGACTPAEIATFAVPRGYTTTISWLAQPIKVQPPERLAANRRRLLAARAAAKAPLFAEEFVAAEIARQPDYYAGENNRGPARDEILASEAARREYLAARANRLIVYWREEAS